MKLKKFWLPAFFFLITFLVVGKNLDKEFVGVHDWNGARYGNIARNYIRYGLFTTMFSQIENSGVEKSKNFKFLTHYPPLLPISISFSYRIFGIYESATRLVPILATSGLTVVIYLIGRTIFDGKVGFIAGLLALSTPMVRYYGKNPVHEPIALFFASIAFLGTTKVLNKKKNGWILIYLGLIFALFTTWSGVFLILGLTIALVKEIPNAKIINLWFLGILLFLTHFLYIYIVTGSFFGGGLIEVLLQRTSLVGAASQTEFSVYELLNIVRLWASNLFTISLIVTFLIGIFFVFKYQKSHIKRIIFGILIYSIGYPLVFPNATFIHEYFIYYLVLPLTLLASYGLSKLFQNKVLWFMASLVLVFAIWLERVDYIKALEESSGDKLAVQIGKVLNQKISMNDIVLIEPYAFAASRLPHLSFYSDRVITLDQSSEYNWIINIDETTGLYNLLRK